MDTETQKLLDEQLKKLPANLRGAIEAVPWKSSLKEIAAQNGIPADQLEDIERETTLILYGFEKPEDYINNLVREVKLSEETASAFAYMVSQRVFMEISAKAESTPEIPVAPASVPEIAPSNLPMVEEGETVHDVPPMDKSESKEDKPIEVAAPSITPTPVPEIQAPTIDLAPKPVETKPEAPASPSNRYPDGKDPYREPLV